MTSFRDSFKNFKLPESITNILSINEVCDIVKLKHNLFLCSLYVCLFYKSVICIPFHDNYIFTGNTSKSNVSSKL